MAGHPLTGALDAAGQRDEAVAPALGHGIERSVGVHLRDGIEQRFQASLGVVEGAAVGDL
ncbi:hypothetical protein D3C78_1018860 [compost metagenome]